MLIKTSKTEAINYAGSQTRLADILGITKQAVQNWGEYLPQTSARNLYIITDSTIGTRINE
jgi:DNA-binding transcriptional regulator YdaS (Cro superfamily)